ncbi:PIG-L family deacetylase [Microbacterium sp. GXF7504]
MSGAAAGLFSVWAHYDDDLIFGCPTIDRAVVAGAPVTALFLTAGDAGRDAAYVEAREEGLRAAYARMHGAPLAWRDTALELAGVRATGWTAQEAPIRLLSLRLPDGRPNGSGFAATGNLSLRRLLEGDIAAIESLEQDAALTADDLERVLAAAVLAHPGAGLLAHAPRVGGTLTERDHSDHWATGAFLQRALVRAGLRPDAVSWRIGYPSASLPEVLHGAELARKVEVFRAYAAHDPVVARPDPSDTLELPGFGAWLRREYALVDGTAVPLG